MARPLALLCGPCPPVKGPAGPVDCSSACFPPPARAPPQAAQRPGRLQVRPRTLGGASCLPAEAGGGGSHRPGRALSPRGPPAPRRQGRDPCRLQPASPHPLLQAFPRSQSPEVCGQHGLTRPCPWGEPGPSGGRPSAPGRYPTESPSSLALRVARRGGRPPLGLKHRFLLGAAVYGLCNTQTI